jgi:hypothetical protein
MRTASPKIAEVTDLEDRWMWHMRRGEFAAAWRISDLVLRQTGGIDHTALPRHLQPVWNGTSPWNRRVLVRCYHGLGDTLQFIRYAPFLKSKAAEVIVWAQPSLLSLLQRVPGIDRLLPLHDGAPECRYDVDVEIMELPFLFRTTLESLPATVPYIEVEPARISDSRFKVGLVWRAGDWDAKRNVPFLLMKRLAEVDGASFYILQQDTERGECRDGFRRILQPFGDAMATARIIRALDLVITVDSMPAHLAGALAVPTWTLLQRDADWRWMDGRADSPWYPTMRLFRQRKAGAWQPLIEHVIDELAHLIDSGPPSI